MRAESEKKRLWLWVAGAACLGAGLTALGGAALCAGAQYRLLGQLCGLLLGEKPELAPALLRALKACRMGTPGPVSDPLRAWGYQSADFWPAPLGLFGAAGAVGLLAAGLFLFWACLEAKQKRAKKLADLAARLEALNRGGRPPLLGDAEDELACLRDELDKTVAGLYHTREQALRDRDRFAENLAGIAHQLKTPITAISLCAQRLGQGDAGVHVRRIQEQLRRLTRLEEALLLLARIEAGVLRRAPRPTEAYTLISLAADSLETLFEQAGVKLTVDEGQAPLTVDPDWTLEALINLMKNCLEHSPPGGTVHVCFEKNPLYTRLLLWDEGEGFAREDLPHLFQRFYRGQNAGPEGVGLGLALAKALIEGENGTLTARNLPGGGACFEVRFYMR